MLIPFSPSMFSPLQMHASCLFVFSPTHWHLMLPVDAIHSPLFSHFTRDCTQLLVVLSLSPADFLTDRHAEQSTTSSHEHFAVGHPKIPSVPFPITLASGYNQITIFCMQTTTQ